MENIGLNSEVSTGGKNFHIQTQYSESTEKIVSNIFDNGKVIVARGMEIKSNTPARDIKLHVNQLHQDVIADLEMLFFISEKVRSVRHSVSNNKLGLVFLKRNLFDEAIAEFERAVEIDPDFGEAYNNLGSAYLKRKSYPEAIDAFTRGIEKNVGYADLHNNLGYAYFCANKYPEAIHQIKTALEKNPKFVHATFNICQVYLKTIIDELPDFDSASIAERIEKVKELLTSIVDQNQYFKTNYLESAIDYLTQNNFPEAMKLFEMAASDLPEKIELDYESEFYLKFMFGGKGKDNDFIFEYTKGLKQAVANYPEYADLRNNLGIAYLIQCRNLFLNALDEFRQALEIDPDYKKAEKNLKLAENDGKGFLILLRAILK